MALKSVTRLGTLVAGASLVALLAAACGSDDSNDGGSGGNGDNAPPPGNDAVVSVQDSNAGSVLTASTGKAMYTSEQETDGTVLCVDSCTTFWEPVMVDAAAPTSVDGVSGTLGTVDRPDGGTQLTLDGAPLYTFSSDRPGMVTADNLPDSFGDQSFVWHVATADGSAAAPPSDSVPTYTY